MAEQTTRTTGNDAPLSAAKNPDPRAMAAPGDRTVEWDSVVTEDVPGSVIAWASVKGAGRDAEVDSPGDRRFAGGRA